MRQVGWLLLGLLAGLPGGSSAAAPSPPCVHTLASGASFDLSAFRNTTLFGPESTGGRFAQSLCGELPITCEDALTHANMTGV